MFSKISKFLGIITLSLSLCCNYILGQIKVPVEPDLGNVSIHKRFRVNYDCVNKIPFWNFEYITKQSLNNKIQRFQNFSYDEKLICNTGNYKDYQNQKTFDKGHLVPCGDFMDDSLLMTETFIYSNCVPQVSSFNRGIWKYLEIKIRENTVYYDTIYIITGCVYNKHIKINTITIPEYMYKILLFEKNGKYVGVSCYYMPNIKLPVKLRNIESYSYSVFQLQKDLNCNFYPMVSDNVKKNIVKLF
jgi:endonuclease G